MEMRNWSKELRLGNYVMDSPINGDEPLKVDAIYSELVIHHGENDDRHIYKEEIRPILLTEELMLKLGFEKGKHAWFSKKYFTDCDEYAEVMKIDYNISSKRLAIYDAIEETDMVNILSHPIYTGKRVLYLHQLQNLYFALVGEELQINLTTQ